MTTSDMMAGFEQACAEHTPVILGRRRYRITGLGTCPDGQCTTAADCPGCSTCTPKPAPRQSLVQPMRKPGCVFCAVAAGEAPAAIVRSWVHTIAIKPRGGVHPGHVLVIPRTHVADVGEAPAVSARAMACAAELAAEMPAANVITSKGADATQTVFHLHIHVVPRAAGDGLALPWTARHSTAGAA